MTIVKFGTSFFFAHEDQVIIAVHLVLYVLVSTLSSLMQIVNSL